MRNTVDQERITKLEGQVSRQAERIDTLSSRLAMLTSILEDAGLGGRPPGVVLRAVSYIQVTPDGDHLAQRVAALMDHLGLLWAYVPGGWSLHPRKIGPEISGDPSP